MDREQTLIRRAKDGDVGAFEELIAPMEKSIFSLAFKMMQNREDAEDITQDVLVKLFQNLSKFQGNAKFSTWAYRIATNTCLDAIKKKSGKTAFSLDQEIETEEGTMGREVQDKGPTPEEALEKKMMKQAVYAAIGALKDEHKKVLVLRDLQGLSYEEIAAMLSLTEGTVKSRINRARQALKKILEKDRELFSKFIVK